ncbi:hypothetical protein C6P45_002398 [Maudiozyma exigua]|uniref:PA14 domain-containing protein n=1 Tax=Maudiozyma exigua TaxID=34358 RepID=A0A9P6VYY9_MAUEX|nr:hypothetical protein C6P45_002398 [Kazachstania exigua]
MRFTIVSTIVTYIICYSGSALATGSTGASCTPSLSNSSDGFQAKFFKYIYPDYARESSDEYFIATGYNKPHRLITTLTGITDINFYHFYNFNTNGPTWGLINDYNITISNFTESGDYTFQIGQTDDGSRIEIYENSSYQFCDMTVNKTVLQNIQYYDSSHISTATVKMEAGLPYPIKVVYFNKDSVAIETIQFTDPSGSIHNTFDGYVVHYKDITCPTTTPEEETLSLYVTSSNVVSSNAMSSGITASSVISSSNTLFEISSSETSLSTTSSSETSSSETSLSTTSSSIISSTATTSVTSSSVSELYFSINTFTSIRNSRLSTLDDPIVSKHTTTLEITSSSLSYSSSSNLTSSTSTRLMSSTSTVSLIFITSSISTIPINMSPAMDIIPLTTNSVKSLVTSSSNLVSSTPSPTGSKATVIDKSSIVLHSTINSEMSPGGITPLVASSDPEPSNIASSSILAHVMMSSIAPSSTSTVSFSSASFNNSIPRVTSSKTSSQTNTIHSHSSIFQNGTHRLSSIRALSQSTHSYDPSVSLLSTHSIHPKITSATESAVKPNAEIHSVITMSYQAIKVPISSSRQYIESPPRNTTRTSRYLTVSTTCSTNIPHTSYTNQNIDFERSKNISNDIVSTVSNIKYSSTEAKSNKQSSITNVGTKLIPGLAVQSTTSQITRSTSQGIQININGGISAKGNNGITYLILLMLTSFI